MRRLILKMSVSLDLFVGGPKGELDWVFKSMDEEVTAWTVERLWRAGVHIMGSRTYHDMAAYWPVSTEPFAAPMNEIPKVVFSRKGVAKDPESDYTTTALKDAARARAAKGERTIEAKPEIIARWNNARVASGLLDEEIKYLKRESGKDILAHGGARFAQNLVKTGMIDEYQLLVHPTVLGNGLPLFSSISKPTDMKLVDSKIFKTGVIAQVYQPA